MKKLSYLAQRYKIFRRKYFSALLEKSRGLHYIFEIKKKEKVEWKLFFISVSVGEQ